MALLTTRRAALAALPAALLWPGIASAAELRVVSSGGFAAAYKVLTPAFEHATGHTLTTGWGPSMGATPDAVPARLARQEPIDVLIMVGYALKDLEAKGRHHPRHPGGPRPLRHRRRRPHRRPPPRHQQPHRPPPEPCSPPSPSPTPTAPAAFTSSPGCSKPWASKPRWPARLA